MKAPIIRENPIAAKRIAAEVEIMAAIPLNDSLGWGKKGRMKSIMAKLNTKGLTNVEVSFPALIIFRKIKMTAIKMAAMARNR